jgi:hypothetical protein
MKIVGNAVATGPPTGPEEGLSETARAHQEIEFVLSWMFDGRRRLMAAHAELAWMERGLFRTPGGCRGISPSARVERAGGDAP